MRKHNFFKGILLVLAIAMALPLGGNAQNAFKFGIVGESSNLWSLPVSALVGTANTLFGIPSASYYDVSWYDMKSADGASVDVKGGSFFGLRARDLFNNFGVGVRMEYSPVSSPVGAFVTGMYKYRQFRMLYAPVSDTYEKYQTCIWSVGVGLDIVPMVSALNNGRFSPVIEISESYNKVFDACAPFANSLDQFGSGLKTRIGVGLKHLGKKDKLLNTFGISFEMQHYDCLDKGFKTPDGKMPFANLKSRHFSVGLFNMITF